LPFRYYVAIVAGLPVHSKNKKESLLHRKKNFVREESKPTMRDFIEDNQSELDSYPTYLFNQINNNSEIPLGNG
jgi:hypothetical protein